MLLSFIIIIGLVALEVVNSIDNAIINAHMLQTMSQKAKRWFLTWGMLFAVFLVRGLLPLLIVWITAPGLSFLQAVKATFSSDPVANLAMANSAYILLLGGGMFLLLLYFHWLFLEKKDPYFVPDKLIKAHHGVWFFAVAAILLVTILWLSKDRPLAMIAAAVGNAIFFILYGFRKTAEESEHVLESAHISDLSKLLFLEILDMSFSIDGILGAFAFTTNVALILIGNGLGALVVREFTIRGTNYVAKYRWIKNGAMSSIGCLGLFMLLEAFGLDIPKWLPTVITLGLIGLTFWESHRHLQQTNANS